MLPVTVGGEAPFSGGDPSCPLSSFGRGWSIVHEVTYEELFQFTIMLIAFASLIFQIIKKK